jgi:hypothetical protein
MTRTRSFALGLATLALGTGAEAAPLTVVNVGAPAVNCVFNQTCKVTVTDSIGALALPGASGNARLQSRTYVGKPGAPASDKTAYVYRLDLTQAVGIVNIPCVSALRLDFGAVTNLDYDKNGTLEQVFVVTSGGLGSVGLASADKLGNVITFNLSAPVCAGSSPGKGDTSFFFGLATATSPKPATAQVRVTGGAWIDVAARVPKH